LKQIIDFLVRENALIPELCFTRFSLPFFLLLKSFQVRGCRLKAASQPPTLGITTMSILSKAVKRRTGFSTKFFDKLIIGGLFVFFIGCELWMLRI